MNTHPHKLSGFTLVEMLIAGALVTILGGLAMYGFNNILGLYVKNTALNTTNNGARSALDRMTPLISAGFALDPSGANGVSLVTSAGTTTGTSSAAGILFDSYVGGYYVVPGTGVANGSTQVTLTGPLSAELGAPIPQINDVIRFEGNNVRARISASPTVTETDPTRSMVCTLVSATPQAVNIQAGQTLRAYLVRQRALIVVPNGNRNELRYYHRIEGQTNMNEAGSFSVLTTYIGGTASDLTPFSIVNTGGRPRVSINLRTKATNVQNAVRRLAPSFFNDSLVIQTFVSPKS